MNNNKYMTKRINEPTQGNKLTLNASPVAMISTRVRVKLSTTDDAM